MDRLPPHPLSPRRKGDAKAALRPGATGAQAQTPSNYPGLSAAVARVARAAGAQGTSCSPHPSPSYSPNIGEGAEVRVTSPPSPRPCAPVGIPAVGTLLGGFPGGSSSARIGLWWAEVGQELAVPANQLKRARSW